MQVELKRIQSEVGITFIYVTHDQDEALAMSDRWLCLPTADSSRSVCRTRSTQRPASAFVAGFVGTPTSSPATWPGGCGCDRAVHRAAGEAPLHPPTPPTTADGRDPGHRDIRTAVYLGERTRHDRPRRRRRAGGREQNRSDGTPEVLATPGTAVRVAGPPLRPGAPAAPAHDQAAIRLQARPRIDRPMQCPPMQHHTRGSDDQFQQRHRPAYIGDRRHRHHGARGDRLRQQQEHQLERHRAKTTATAAAIGAGARGSSTSSPGPDTPRAGPTTRA